MTKEEALKQFAMFGAAWFGNSKQHFAFSAYCRLQGWNKLADKWKEEAEEEWEEAEEVLQRLVELGCKPADLQEAMKTIEFPFYDDPKQQIESDYNPEGINQMSEVAAAFADDYPTQKLIQKWIDGEKDHMAWEAQYLNYIDKLGYEKEQVLKAMREAGKPVSAGDVTKALNADRKEVDKAFAELKKEGAIVSPVRCKWEPAK